jgi:MarR family transcriptional regulator, 2-MHQ and catechol-resistance regulon repressor
MYARLKIGEGAVGMKKKSAVTPTGLWTVLAKCHHALRLVVECSIDGTGLVLSDFMVLEALLHKGPLTITGIQDKVLLATGSMTAAVDRVERKGLVVRTTTEKDRRAKVLELTTTGRRMIEAAYAKHAKDLTDVMSVLTKAEKAEMYGLAKKLGRGAAEIGKRKAPKEMGNAGAIRRKG